MHKTYKPTILIDLDGILNKYNSNYDKNFIPKIDENTKSFLKKIHSLDKYIKNNIDKLFSKINDFKVWHK